MALSKEQRHALDSLATDWPLLIYPTVWPGNYRPLLPLASVDPADLLSYGRKRGWSEFEMGRILGAAQFMQLIAMTGVDYWQDVLEPRDAAD